MGCLLMNSTGFIKPGACKENKLAKDGKKVSFLMFRNGFERCLLLIFEMSLYSKNEKMKWYVFICCRFNSKIKY